MRWSAQAEVVSDSDREALGKNRGAEKKKKRTGKPELKGRQFGLSLFSQ
jgi:hypothetical protein